MAVSLFPKPVIEPRAVFSICVYMCPEVAADTGRQMTEWHGPGLPGQQRDLVIVTKQLISGRDVSSELASLTAWRFVFHLSGS